MDGMSRLTIRSRRAFALGFSIDLRVGAVDKSSITNSLDRSSPGLNDGGVGVIIAPHPNNVHIRSRRGVSYPHPASHRPHPIHHN